MYVTYNYNYVHEQEFKESKFCESALKSIPIELSC